MFEVRVPKSYKETEDKVIGFIITRFSDPIPGFPLSKDVLSRLFSSEFLHNIFSYSRDIGNGYFPDKAKIQKLFKTNHVDYRSFYLLTRMIKNYLDGLTVTLTDIEEMHLAYDYVPPYYSSDEYLHFEYMHTFFERIINYSEN